MYAELGRALDLESDVVEQLIAAECEVEARLLHAVPEAVELVRDARRAGATVAFLSDMYLPSAFVAEQLGRHGLLQDGDVLMISCETGTPKWTGAAFERVTADRGISLSDLSHTGDHERSDVIVPRRLGVQVRPFSAAAINRYEELLESQSAATEGLASSLAGASRLTRLALPVEDPDHVAIRDVAAGVVAPAMVGFTLWVLRRAEQLGLRRLYFVARDGQILVDVARRLIARLGLDIECVYLFGSRLAWWLPSLASVDESELEWAFATHDRIDARTVTNRLNLSPEVSADLLARPDSATRILGSCWSPSSWRGSVPPSSVLSSPISSSTRPRLPASTSSGTCARLG